MRNLLWSGTALVLLAGAGMFVAGQHAVRHPESYVGRCAAAIYHMWDSSAPPRGEPIMSEEIAQASEAPSVVVAKSAPAAEVVEPIVVEPTDEEPPLASPRLSPEIAAAIERLRGEEESEAPPKAFDGTAAALYMPYADEDSEVLPTQARSHTEGRPDVALPGSAGFFVLPPACWQAVLDRVLESIRRFGQMDGSEEPADRGTGDDEIPTGFQPSSMGNHHGQSCPFTGPYPTSYQFRHELPRASHP